MAKNSDLVEVYDHVIEEFDRFLAEHGYVREGAHYRVEKESDETVTFFCHFGISCVLLSHLWNVSPFVLWHSLVSCTDFCDRSSNRRERTGNGIFPRIESRRYLTSLCRWRRTVLLQQDSVRHIATRSRDIKIKCLCSLLYGFWYY